MLPGSGDSYNQNLDFDRRRTCLAVFDILSRPLILSGYEHNYSKPELRLCRKKN